jgi:hypothetical protein
MDPVVPRIPLELHPTIIQNLQPIPRYDREETKLALADLAACALVCSAWRPIAQSLIYYSIEIPYHYDEMRDLPKMLNNFTKHPHISSFVKEVVIHKLNVTYSGTLELMITDRSREVFSLFPNISNLILKFLFFTGSSVDIDARLGLTRSSLRNIRQLSLGYFELGLSSLQRLIEAFPSLQALSLHGAALIDSYENGIVNIKTIPRPPFLQYCTIKWYNGARQSEADGVASTLSAMAAHNVRHLALHIRSLRDQSNETLGVLPL